MTSEDFRRLALGFPETVEGSHMDHPDFRVRGKIFATLFPYGPWGVVMLTPEQQKEFMRKAPEVFVPAKGAWGRRGCTQVLIKAVASSTLRKAITAAWHNKAPAALVDRLDKGTI